MTKCIRFYNRDIAELTMDYNDWLSNFGEYTQVVSTCMWTDSGVHLYHLIVTYKELT